MASRPAHSEQRRQQILDAAARVISDRGLCDARIADIASAAATSTGLILYYFGSKDNLLSEALTSAEDHFYLHIFRTITDIDDPRRQLAELVAGSCPGTPDAHEGVDAEWRLWVELWARALHDPEVARRRAALDRRWRSTIADVVRTGQHRDVFATAIDAQEFALELAALMDGLALQVELADTEVDGARMLQLSMAYAMRRLAFQLDEVPAV
ncbi:TetR/AcrR family transcriptional regulator [soil metagenome]